MSNRGPLGMSLSLIAFTLLLFLASEDFVRAESLYEVVFDDDIAPEGLYTNSNDFLSYPMTSPSGTQYTCYQANKDFPEKEKPSIFARELADSLHIGKDYLGKHCYAYDSSHGKFEICPGNLLRVIPQNVDNLLSESEPLKSHEFKFVEDSFRLYTDPIGRVVLKEFYKSPENNTVATAVYSCHKDFKTTPMTKNKARGQLVEAQSMSISSATHGDNSFLVHMDITSKKLCPLMTSATNTIRSLNSTCIEHSSGGWWTWEICIGKYIKQFHVEGAERDQESMIGIYDWEFGERVVGTAAKDKTLAPLERTGSDQFVADEGVKPLAIVQSYTNGSICDINGQPRKAVVRFECGKKGKSQLEFISIDEPSTCVYSVSFSSNAVCSHPAFRVDSSTEEAGDELITIRCYRQ